MRLAALKRMQENMRRLLRGEAGQDLVEYGLLAGLIAVVAVATVTALGNQINTVFWQMIVNNF